MIAEGSEGNREGAVGATVSSNLVAIGYIHVGVWRREARGQSGPDAARGVWVHKWKLRLGCRPCRFGLFCFRFLGGLLCLSAVDDILMSLLFLFRSSL